MKTTWQEIKERVELKIGEDIDMSEFSVLANESISDLQEIAMVKAPVRHYREKDIMTEDEEWEFGKDDIAGKGTPILDLNNAEYAAVWLPFEYNVGYGELEITSDEDNAYMFQYKEDVGFSKSSRILILMDPKMQSFIKNDATNNATYKVTRKTMSVVGKESCKNELVVDKPDNMFMPIDLKLYNAAGLMFDVELTTSTNPFDKEYRYGTKTHSAYYIDNGKIHIFTEVGNVKNISFIYYKTMDKIDKRESADQQVVELEPGFENLLTFAICHKWMENFVGVDDQETKTMFNKYLALKQEYEHTAKQRKVERRQTRIIEAY